MLKDQPVKEVITETKRVLNKALESGIQDNQPPGEMLAKLQNDVFVFSSCKTHIQLKEVSTMLVDDSGKIRSFQQFQEKVSEIHATYNERYLEAEYIFATSSSEMAAKWIDLAKDGDRYNLQYRTAKDNHVRETHKVLDGITLPPSDPFWDSYYPPNGWRCRCVAVQVLKEKYPQSDSEEAVQKGEKATTQIDANGKNTAEMFRFNPGKQQVIFPQSHPYYKVKSMINPDE